MMLPAIIGHLLAAARLSFQLKADQLEAGHLLVWLYSDLKGSRLGAVPSPVLLIDRLRSKNSFTPG